MRAFALWVMLLMLPLAGAQAVLPDEMLQDPALEKRARALSQHIRCLVCQNQSIDDSNADLARDLRVLVRERLKAGDSDDEVFAYLTARYGDFVLLKPPFKASTYVLWIGPACIFVIAVIGLAVYFRRRNTLAAEGGDVRLNSEERERLARLLDEEDGQR